MLAAAPLLAQDTNTTPLPPGVALLPEDALGAFRLTGKPGEDAQIETINVENPALNRALRARTLRLPGTPYSIQLNAPTIAPVQKGDALLATFWTRAVQSGEESGEVRTAFIFEEAKAPYDKSIATPLTVGGQWQKFQLPFAARENYAAGAARVNLHLGFKPQTIEFGGLSLINYGQTVKLADLPRTRHFYKGLEPDAPWRKAAAERIEQHRKGDLTINVTNADGRPIEAANVQVRMKRHAFVWGSAINSGYFWDKEGTPDNQKYREQFVKLFNRAVEENAMKWPGFDNPKNREQSVKVIEWLKRNNIPMRGHNLIWPGWSYLPGREETDLAKAPNGLRANYEALKAKDGETAAKAWLRQRVTDHIREQATFFKGKVTDWDVMNEPYTNHALQDILGDEVMVEWFKIAKAADPDAKHYINDYGILRDDTAHQEHYYKTIQFLLDKGAPVEGIGEQSHMGGNTVAPERLLQILDRLGLFKLPILITELDMEAPDEALIGDYLRDYTIAVFSHPSVEGIIMWGFWDGLHWKNNAPLFRKDWSLKPSGKAWMDLVFNQWWTNAQGTTSAAGQYKTRGFLGDYEITATAGGKTKTVPAKLAHQGRTLEIRFD